MMSYCSYCADPKAKEVHRKYHDNLYGFPLNDDNELFGRLLLEINQAGLSWETILNKEANFRAAYADFNIKRVAQFDDNDRNRLLNDAGIIRNKLKVNAAIHNAKVIEELQNDFGSFEEWLETHHPRSRDEWTKLFKKTFKFVGGEIVGEFLMSIGYLQGAHEKNCPVFDKILKKEPKWRTV
jgi:DNA-3-methyladenine glycosylase I